MKKKLLMILMSFVLLSACKNDDEEDPVIPEPIIEVICMFKTEQQPNTEFIDIDAVVYIYYKKCTIEFANYDYIENGIFTREGQQVIKPDAKQTINKEGKAIFHPEPMDENVSILIQSNFYEGRTVGTCFSSTKEKIKYKAIFLP